MTHVGFTGTQRGMTVAQRVRFEALINDLDPLVFHHGDCEGADEQAHEFVYWHASAEVVIHPPANDNKRAYCRGDETRPEKDYLDRNQDIVDESETLIATPGEEQEKLRSGTWATVRRARKKGIDIYIIFPDGTVKHENGRVRGADPR